MLLTLESAYEQPEVMRSMIQEYVDTLILAVPPFASYLQVQHCDAELANLRQKYGKPDGRLYLARADGKPAGCVALRKLDDKTCEMKRLYVRPQFRRKRIGAALVNRLLSDAREIGYQYMNLDTLPMLTTAIHMYRRLGFYEIPRYNDSPLPETIFMQLKL
ncbi:GNAT family N-acetyltransferase [Oscillibacter valericigenes]|uniref:GNAT family N-acetyltransferase n=1 Tax=Oscillibacter ruminantium TaxID=1263547 RepID=UPI00058C40EE|nr:GNAT family N-acetyltransferase [Oscillibacter ruminantium]MDN0032890.1 GNAT family N-acetyltransferase [Oscillibacter valericigenes]MEA5042691.1 GNAT family N-acetyltransferase [Oscillibacter ruminantium]